MENLDFDGVFRFTNVTKEDFTALWNNKEYFFPAGRTVPMIIPEETLENIQEIRKKFAYKLAVREFYSGTLYKKMKEMGKGLPPTFDEKLLEPMIEECLKPLPIEKLVITPVKRKNQNLKGSKAVSDKDNLNYVFKDDEPDVLGKMSDK